MVPSTYPPLQVLDAALLIRALLRLSIHTLLRQRVALRERCRYSFIVQFKRHSRVVVRPAALWPWAQMVCVPTMHNSIMRLIRPQHNQAVARARVRPTQRTAARKAIATPYAAHRQSALGVDTHAQITHRYAVCGSQSLRGALDERTKVQCRVDAKPYVWLTRTWECAIGGTVLRYVRVTGIDACPTNHDGCLQGCLRRALVHELGPLPSADQPNITCCCCQTRYLSVVRAPHL